MYIVHHCRSIRKLTVAQELPKHVFFQNLKVLFSSLRKFVNVIDLLKVAARQNVPWHKSFKLMQMAHLRNP